MSYAAFQETGSGGLGVRVMIPGLPVEFVSDPSMETTTADGRRRICCLAGMGEGIVFEERINIPEATADATSNRIALNETADQALSQLFNSLPERETYLTATSHVNGTQLQVLSSSGFSAGDVVHLGTEAILIASVSNGILHVQSRGYWDSVAQSHYSDDANVGGVMRVVTSAPARIRGRRLYVYLYGEGDDPTGDGNRVWVGKCTSDPSLDNGNQWSFGADNILAALRCKLGTEMESGVRPRGAYYHWAAPLQIQITEDGAPLLPFKLFGFYETEDDFVAALQAKLSAIAGADSTYEAKIIDGRWTIAVTVGPSTSEVQLFLNSPVDGGEITSTIWKDADGNVAPTLSSGTKYFIDWSNSSGVRVNGDGVRDMPRGFFGLPPQNFDRLNPFYSDGTLATIYPDNRIYLGVPVSSDWTAVQIKWPVIASTGFGGGTSIDLDSTNTTDNWIMPRAVRLTAGAAYSNASLPEVRFGRTIAVGSLADFLQNLTHDAPVYANRLSLPALWTSDFDDMGAIRSVLDGAASGRAWLLHRIFTVFSPADVDKYISQHLRLLNCYPCLSADGTITFARFEVPNASTTGISSIDDEIWLDTLASLAPEEQGVYNVVRVKTGYDAVSDKFTGREYVVHDWRAFADEQEQHELTIEPHSVAATGDQEISETEMASVGNAYLGYFASPYKVVSGIAVSWQLYGLRCGSVVAISSEYLPAFDGLRPMDEVVGIVVSRRWALGEPFGTLDVIVSAQNIAGYAPAAFIDTGAFANVSGNTYDVTLTVGRYAPEGYDEDEFFAVGDKVRVMTYDSETPTEQTGTVSTVNTTTHVIRIAFDGALTNPQLAQWWLVFQDYAASTTAQQVYCYIADNGGQLGTDRARTFAA